ncbi:MAG TPA: NAD-dependent epimerase/dehydratase family protein [Micromonosporaceae bacterium]
MKVAVTGATGNVGTALLRRLSVEPDIEVVGFARRTPGPGAGPPYDRVEWHSIDVGAADAVERLTERFRGADAVVHLAWQNVPTYHRPHQRATNLRGSRQVCDATVQAGVGSLIYASASAAYSPGPKNRYVDESWPVLGVPVADFSIDKATVEALLDDLERREPQLRVVRLRQALVFQREAGIEFTKHFLGRFGRFMVRRGSPLIPLHRRLRVQVVHAEDVADAYLRVLRGDVRGAFNIAADPPLDGQALAEETYGVKLPMSLGMVRTLTAASWRLGLQPTPPTWVDIAAAIPLMDCSRAEHELGWRPNYDGRHALRDLLDGVAAGAGAPTPALRPALTPSYG